MRFRKRPIVIEAFQMTYKARHEFKTWPFWLLVALNTERGQCGALFVNLHDPESGRLVISTLEGCHNVSWDDWIIKGFKGELYACKPDIFKETYEQVGEES